MRPPLRHWGIEAEVSPMAGGNRNTVWRTHGLAQNLVFKTTRRDELAVLWLIPVLLTARKRAGMQVPMMKPGLSGRWVCEGWTCETLLEGDHVAPEELTELSAQMALFQSVLCDMPQRPGFLSSPALLTGWFGGDVDLCLLPTDLRQLCRDAWRSVSSRVCTVVHGDISPSNVLRQPSGALALVDWDECRFDLSLYDEVPLGQGDAAARRAHLAWEVACSWKREPAYARKMADRLRFDAARRA